MSEHRTHLGKVLFTALAAAKQQPGGITVDVAGAIVEKIIAEQERSLQNEMKQLIDDIESAKRDVVAISTDPKSPQPLTDATDHLDAVIKSTEEASNAIMDAADAIQNAASSLTGDAAHAIMDASMRIYEHCNFQDLTGQRLTKVIKLIDHIEDRVANLLKLFNIEVEAKDEMRPANDTDLLNGPQLPANAATQADIDALFGS